MDGIRGKYKPQNVYKAFGLIQARCELCGAFINEKYTFCPKCGVEIIWDDKENADMEKVTMRYIRRTRHEKE